MAFRDSFHEVIPGYRVNGDVMVFAIKTVKEGGLYDGRKLLEIGNFGIGPRTLIELAAGEAPPNGYIAVESVDDTYNKLELAGMSTVIDGVLVDPAAVALLEYGQDRMMAEAQGPAGQFIFERANVSHIQRVGKAWKIPDADFDTFKDLALQRLTTALEVVGQFSNSYIHFDGSNDYVEFTTKGADNVNLLDWGKSWTLGVTLTEFDVKSDNKFVTLFSSGQNAILLRRGGSNHGLYLTGNDGANKAGINTWYAPNPGGKLLFSMDATTGRMKYYIGNVDGTYALRGSVTISSATGGNNNPGTNFCIGKRVGSNAVAESLMFNGGMNNVIAAKEPLAGPLVQEYFQVNETYDESSFYADLTSWVKMGENDFPEVTDTKGVMTGGAMVNGNEDDFVEISGD